MHKGTIQVVVVVASRNIYDVKKRFQPRNWLEVGLLRCCHLRHRNQRAMEGILGYNFEESY